ncbi:MAG TPA: hypothetical protein VFQ61_16755, partial [Polyangiaceae bacterium]|nr:hypothetical protein [Polyangiaceae bacterium]
AHACFPSATGYSIRVTNSWVLRSSAGFAHSIIAREERGADGTRVFECRRDCNPRKRYFESRVFEITAPTDYCLNGSDKCRVGSDPNSPCVLPKPPSAQRQFENVVPFDVDRDAARKCIFESPTARFAIYRGQEESQEDMSFSWRTTGAFVPLAISMPSGSGGIAPTALTHLPNLDRLSVVDASSLGIVFMSLDSISPISPTLN